MKYRRLGKTNYKISEIGFGGWAIGGSWGHTDDQSSLKALHAAADFGVNFFDTADVYGDGRSERLIARFLKDRQDPNIIVATKAGRRLNPHTASGYTGPNIEKFIDRSLKNLRTDTLDLLQLHCPPTQVYYQPELFAHLDQLVHQGKIRHYGVSVEKVEEAIKALEYPGVSTVQIIFNIFRQRPKDLFFRLARRHDVGIIARVPLASGLLTGKMTPKTKFETTDHRHFNRQGQAFDRGETFAGVDFATGLQAVTNLQALKPANFTLPQLALKWILSHRAVSTTIPGAKTPDQVQDNTSASDLPPLPQNLIAKINRLYRTRIQPQVHHYW